MAYQSDFIYVLFVAIVSVVIFVVAYKFWKGKPKDDFEKTIIDMKIMIFILGFMVAVLMLLLPYPSFLNPSGLPETLGDPQSSEELLSYAKNLGLALERMRDIIYFFLLFFITGLLVSLYQVTKQVSNLRNKDESKPSTD
jgi:membrane protease YdiL (CAAX protease family)